MPTVFQGRISDETFYYKFKQATSAHGASIVTHLVENFGTSDPLCVARDLTLAESRNWFQILTDFSIMSDVSIVAVLTNADGSYDGSIIAVCLVDFSGKPHEDGVTLNGVPLPPDIPETSLAMIREFIAATRMKLWPSLDGIERLYDIKVLSVGARYRKQGIAKNLVEAACDRMAECAEFPGVLSVATTSASRRVFEKAQFQEVKQYFYADFLVRGVPVFANTPPSETYAAVMLRMF